MTVRFKDWQELQSALVRAQQSHHAYEQSVGSNHDWAEWYAQYMFAEQQENN